MCTLLYDLALVENVNDVGALDCAQAVSDCDRGAAFSGGVESNLDDALRG